MTLQSLFRTAEQMPVPVRSKYVTFILRSFVYTVFLSSSPSFYLTTLRMVPLIETATSAERLIIRRYRDCCMAMATYSAFLASSSAYLMPDRVTIMIDRNRENTGKMQPTAIEHSTPMTSKIFLDPLKPKSLHTYFQENFRTSSYFETFSSSELSFSSVVIYLGLVVYYCFC